MKIIKIVAVLASSFLIVLFILIFTVENPETALYKKATEILMHQEGLASNQELVECFPILIDIQSNLNRIAQLRQMIESKTGGPAPIITKEETLQLENYRKRVRHLRKEVRTELTQLTVTYGTSQP